MHLRTIPACLVIFFLICTSLLRAQPRPEVTAEETEVLKAEDAFRLAKLQNDVEALRQIVADEYVGLNQYGARRDKSELLELFKAFKLSSLTRAEAEVRLAGDVAVVRGSQTEVNPAGKERLEFVRVYIKRDGRWRLLSSTQLVPFNY